MPDLLPSAPRRCESQIPAARAPAAPRSRLDSRSALCETHRDSNKVGQVPDLPRSKYFGTSTLLDGIRVMRNRSDLMRTLTLAGTGAAIVVLLLHSAQLTLRAQTLARLEFEVASIRRPDPDAVGPGRQGPIPQ